MSVESLTGRGCLSVFAGGPNLYTEACAGSPEQTFSYDPNALEIFNNTSCITEVAAGELATIGTCTGQTDQQWYYDTFFKQIYNNYTGHCLGIDLERSTSEANIITQECQFASPTGPDNFDTDIFNVSSSSSQSSSEHSSSESSSEHSSSSSSSSSSSQQPQKTSPLTIIIVVLCAIICIASATISGFLLYKAVNNRDSRKRKGESAFKSYVEMK